MAQSWPKIEARSCHTPSGASAAPGGQWRGSVPRAGPPPGRARPRPANAPAKGPITPSGPGTGGAAGFKGTIELGVDRVDLAVQLGLFVAPLRLMVEAELAHDLDQLVARDF